jgi:acetyltransferase-like isoleucine patch superfamily enzyme
MPDAIRKPHARFEDPFEFSVRAMTKLYSLWVSAVYPFASIGRNVSIHYTSWLSRRIAFRIKLGNSVIIRKHTWFNIIPEATGEPNLVIDDGCVIGAQSVISVKNHIHLEKDVILSSSALIMDHNHAFEDVTRAISDQGTTEGGRIRIGQGTWIGHGAAIVCSRGELDLGPNCVVAANAVVARSFPAYSLISGNPARVVKRFDPVKRAWVKGSYRSRETEPTQENRLDAPSIRTFS